MRSECRPRRCRLDLYATRTTQGRKPFIGNGQSLQKLQGATGLDSHGPYGILYVNQREEFRVLKDRVVAKSSGRRYRSNLGLAG